MTLPGCWMKIRSNTFVLNEYYEAELDNYQAGEMQVPAYQPRRRHAYE